MTASSVYLHPQTKKALQALAQSPSHATLLHGDTGVGLSTVAKWLVGKMGVQHVTVVSPDEKGTTGIDTIRDLYQQTRSKQARRAIVIDDADTLTHAAQNAFLKLLEEPNEAIVFVLTTHNQQNLLQTIRSRAQPLRILPLNNKQTQELLNAQGITDATRRGQLLFMATGKPAEIMRLTQNEEYFARQVQYMTDAKQFLQGDTYQRLLVVHKYSGDRTAALQLLASASNILRFTLQRSPQPSLVSQLNKILLTQERIHGNGHIKTQLLNSSF